jgi:hypothetical protein
MDDKALETWGLQFGQYCAQHGGLELQGLALSAAARRFGDAFVAWARRSRERRAQESQAAKRTAYEARFKADYLRYLHSAEVRLREDDPTGYDAFLVQREARRRTLLRFGPHSALLRAFDQEAARLEDLRTFFSKLVLDFASWDASHNHGSERSPADDYEFDRAASIGELPAQTEPHPAASA